MTKPPGARPPKPSLRARPKLRLASKPQNNLHPLSAFKRYARAADPKGDDIVKQMENESDRAVVIILGSLTEDLLKTHIERKFQSLNSDESRRLFEERGPVSSFSARIDIAYALDLLNRKERDQLHLLREIRNRCSHSVRPMNFAVPELRGVCRVYFGAFAADLDGVVGDKARIATRALFIVITASMMLYLTTGSRKAAAAYFRRLGDKFSAEPDA